MSDFIWGVIVGGVIMGIFGGAIIAWLKKEKNIIRLHAKNLEDKLSHHENKSGGNAQAPKSGI